MYANRLLRYFVGADMKDVLAHVVVGGLAVKGLVTATHQGFVALLECQQQDLVLKGAGMRKDESGTTE